MIAAPLSCVHFEPLLAACRSLEARQVTLLGSALRQPLSEVGDIDLYVLIGRMDRFAFRSLCEAGEKTIRNLAAQEGRSWCVELRQGPFKPPPGPRRDLQLHLLLCDEASLAQLPCALIFQRSEAGSTLLGESPPEIRVDCRSRTTWLNEARADLKRWRNAIAADEIPFRRWKLDPEPLLVESRQAASTAWDLRCLLEGAARATDLHYRASVMAGPQNLARNQDLLRPLLSQLHEVPPWQNLPGCWKRLKDQGTTIIERRLDDLSRM